MFIFNNILVKKFILLIFLIILIFTAQLSAQYFGRNKVQYEDFNFQVLETKNFDIYYYEGEKAVAEDAAGMLKQWYSRYVNLFNYKLSRQQPVIIYANHPDFQQTNVISGIVPQGTGGVTEGMRNRMVIPMTGVYEENDHVLGHELVHAFHYDVMKSLDKGLRASRQIPLWLIEGMAEYLTKGRQSPLTSMWLRDAVLHDKVPTVQEITQQARYFPYRYGHALWAYIASLRGDEIILPLFQEVARKGWEAGAKNILHIESDTLSKYWQKAVKENYRPQIQNRTKPKDVGQSILKEKGKTNLAPVVSPDGKKMIFISQRDLFKLDLYLADVSSGEIIKKLSSFDTDIHFDNLRFMNSSGTWSPDSKKIAFVVIRKGDNQIAIFDLDEDRITRVIKVPDVNGIMHLAWSPGGEKLAFFGSSGGIGDLYLLDLDTEQTTKLTDDRFAEIQPTWHPDGNYIAYATDKGAGTDLSELKFSEFNIALRNINTGEENIISMAPRTKHINPQFDKNGENLYFIASPDGFSNVYRYSFVDQQFYKITDVATGISGLTANSPAISLADRADQLVMSVFEDHNYHIYGLDLSENRGESITDAPAQITLEKGALPPSEESNEGLVQAYLSDSEREIAFSDSLEYYDYRPQLQLFYAGRSMVGGTVDRYGVGIGGSVNLYFSDILGNHVLSTNIQARGNLKTLGGEVMYRNRDHRLNWGADLGHIAYLTGNSTSVLDTITVDNQQIIGQVFRRYRQYTYYDRSRGLMEFPINRNRRIELSAGIARIGYDREVRIIESTLDGRTIDRQTEDVPDPEANYLYNSSIATVGDWSFSGFTSPVKGRRYRFELGGTAGTIKYLSALGDYRHYHFINPVTLAFRVLHYGRYLGDADSGVLSPLQIGYRSWVRGYDPRSFERQECTKTGQSDECPAFSRLTGSKVGIFNAEVRLPLFGTQQYGLLNFRYLPTELLAFFDGGVAWTSKNSPSLEWATDTQERVPVFSTGVGARFNIFGYIVAQVYYVYPFQRPDKGAHFGFVLAPGW